MPYNQITTDAFLMCEKSPLGKSTLSSLKTRTKRRPTTALVPQMYSQYNAFGQNVWKRSTMTTIESCIHFLLGRILVTLIELHSP